MREGVTPFPPEFAARYRERGSWQDRSLFDGFRDCLRRLLREWDELGYGQSVMDLVFHADAERVLGL